MKLQLLNLFGILITAAIPAMVAGIKALAVPRTVVPMLPLLLGALAFVAAGLQQGNIVDTKTLWEFILTGFASGGIASSARDIWHQAIADPK